MHYPPPVVVECDELTGRIYLIESDQNKLDFIGPVLRVVKVVHAYLIEYGGAGGVGV